MSPTELVRRNPRPAAFAGVVVLLLAVVVPVRLTLVRSLAAPVVTVNSTADVGDLAPGDGACDTGGLVGADAECTLRAALEEANVPAGGVDTIEFDVPTGDPGRVGDVVTFTPTTPLPTLAVPMTIDGRSQANWVDDPIVAIDGTTLPGPLLDVDGGSTSLFALALHGGAGVAVDLDTAGADVVRSTWVGLLPDGVTVDAPGGDAIRVGAGATGTELGGTGAGEGLRIAAAGGHGVRVLADGTSLVASVVGLAADGTAVGVTGDGVHVDGALGVAVLDSTVTASGGDGVRVVGGADDVAVVGTVVVANGGLGVDLGGDGVTPNDAGDTDGGDNQLLNHPVVVGTAPGVVRVELDVPGGTHTIEVFANPVGTDPSGAGEGEVPVGGAVVSHPGGAPAVYDVPAPLVAAGDVLTALVTEGAGPYGATSEFSPAVTAELAVVNDGGDAGDAAPGDGVCSTGGTNVDGAVACTLRAALEEAAASAVDGVGFAVPGGDPSMAGGVVTLTPGADLPPVPAGTVVDATTQTGWSGAPVVAIDAAGTTTAGLLVPGAGSEVRGLAVHGGPGHGLLVTGDDVRVEDTWVGLLPDGSTVDGVGGDGVRVDGAARVVVDGGAVHGSAGNGVTVAGAADDVAVVATTVVGSGGIAIDLGDDGPTPNDPLDADTGPNELLNAAVPAVATPDEVVFDLDVPPGDYRVDLFRNPDGGDGLEEFVATTTVSPSLPGTSSHAFTGLTLAEDDVVTLLVTEDTAGVPGSTSEVSAPIVADDHVALVNDTGDGADLLTADGVCSTGGTNAVGDPACTLRAAIQQANATPRIVAIRFEVPGADTGNVGGVVTITPGSDLPPLTAAVELDATTQPGWSADPVVAVDGRSTTATVLTVAGNGSSVSGLALHGGDGDGLRVTGDDVTVTGTWVGLLPDGTTLDGVTGDGVVADGAVGVLLQDGTVRGSGGAGVVVRGAADDVAVVGTTTADNAGLGIDLGDDGVTPNDAGDGDGGPNQRLNHPVVTALSEATGTVTLQVSLDAPAGPYLLQVHTAAQPDPAGAGEGEVLVHSASVVNPAGVGTHVLSFPGDLSRSFTVTATEETGPGSWGATSEYSGTATRPVANPDPGRVPAVAAAAGALSHWRLGEPAGDATLDLGPVGADGTARGGPTRGVAGALTGDDDTATAFDGTDDAVVVPHDPAFLVDEGTVVAWVRPDVLGADRTLVAKDATGFGDGGHLELRLRADGSVAVDLGTTSGTTTVTTAAGVVGVGAWHHVATTFGPRGLELWVDGRRLAADTTATTGWGTSGGGAVGNTEPITLGASQRSATQGTADVLDRFLDGRLDEVVLLGTQVDGATITALAGAARQDRWVTTGPPLAVAAGAGVLANDHDADGDALTAALVTGPSSAAAFALQPDGSFSYTPTAGFAGTDTFTYAVDDGTTTSAPATATVQVAPTPRNRTVDDSTGNGHTGEALGGMTSGDGVTGVAGGAFDLDGSDDRVRIDNLDVVGDRLTLSAWVDPDTLGTDPVVLAKAVGVADADVRWRLLVADVSAATGRPAGSVRTTGGLATATASATVDVADGWVHVAARYDGAAVTLFVDGVAVATAPQAGNVPTNPSVPATIGAGPAGGRAFDGRVDEVRVSHVARSDAWLAAEHATQEVGGAAVAIGAVESAPSAGWTTDTAQARSGTASARAPSGVLRSWLTLDGLAEAGLEASAWWRVDDLAGLDLGQGVRAGDAGGAGPVQQDETGLGGPAGWDLGQVDGGRSQLVLPPGGQTPAADAWQRVVVRIDPLGALSATADGVDVPTSGAAPGGLLPLGTFGLRLEQLPAGTSWWVDDLRVRRYVTPEPVAELRRTELAP